MSRHPQNGPTFSQSPKKQKPMTDDERADWQARKDAEREQTERDAARLRRLDQLFHKDIRAYLREFGLKKND